MKINRGGKSCNAGKTWKAIIDLMIMQDPIKNSDIPMSIYYGEI